MTDKELLELAAKAAGLQIEWHSEMAGSFPVYKNDAGSGYTPWNPLEDDGDTFRLAAALDLSTVYMDEKVCVFRTPGAVTHEWGLVKPHFSDSGMTVEPINGDRPKATRYAVTRAAARLADRYANMPILRGY